MDLQWTQTADQVIIKDVPLPYEIESIDIKMTNATIRVVDSSNNVILQGITCGNVKGGSFENSHSGFIDIYLEKEDPGKMWASLFREEIDPGVYICEVAAIGNYTAEEPIELTIHKGDIIYVISKDETGWWKGKCKNKIGFFPSNFVKEFPSTPVTVPPTAPRKATQPSGSTGATKENSTVNTPKPQPTPTAATPKVSGSTPSPAKVSNPAPSSVPKSSTPKQQRPPSASESVSKRSAPKIPISETLRPRRSGADPAAKPNLVEIIGIAKTLYEYKAADPSELSFGPDEHIYIIEKDSSGWWKGESTSNVIGWFSSTYVKELDLEVAREMFALNLMAEIDEQEEIPKPAERKRTFSASMRESPKRVNSASVSPKIDMTRNQKRDSGVQIHNPQPLNTSGSVFPSPSKTTPTKVDPTATPQAQPQPQPQPQPQLTAQAQPTGQPALQPQPPKQSVPNTNTTVVPESKPVEPAPRVVHPAGGPQRNTIANTGTNTSGERGPSSPRAPVAPPTSTPTVGPRPGTAATATTPAAVAPSVPQQTGSASFAKIKSAIESAYNAVKTMQPSATWQKCVSDPYLGTQDTNRLAVSFCSVKGETFSIGDSHANFPLADIAWPLLYLMMREKVPEKVSNTFKSKDPTAYVVGQTDRALQNPFYFPGAYTLCSWLTEMPEMKYPWDRCMAVLKYISKLMQGYDAKDNQAFLSDKANNIQLQCCMADYLSIRCCFGKLVTMGTFLKEQKIVTTATDVKELADIFNQVHAIEANANIVAIIAANLANNGTHIQSKAILAPSQAVQETLSNMAACGLNNDSKDWQATVKFPSKSSQAGVIMTVIPNVGGIVVYSPPLNVFGNSAKGTEFMKNFVRACPL